MVNIYDYMIDSGFYGPEKNDDINIEPEPLKMYNVSLSAILDRYSDDVLWIDIINSKLNVKDYAPGMDYKQFDYEILEMILNVEEDDADFNSYEDMKNRARLVMYDTRQLKRAIEYNNSHSCKIKLLQGSFSLVGNTIYCSGKPYLHMIG